MVWELASPAWQPTQPWDRLNNVKSLVFDLQKTGNFMLFNLF